MFRALKEAVDDAEASRLHLQMGCRALARSTATVLDRNERPPCGCTRHRQTRSRTPSAAMGRRDLTRAAHREKSATNSVVRGVASHHPEPEIQKTGGQSRSRRPTLPGRRACSGEGGLKTVRGRPLCRTQFCAVFRNVWCQPCDRMPSSPS